LKSRVPSPQAVCLIGGTVIGATFGDKVFPWVEDIYGDPIADIFFGLMGAFFALIAYEIVAMFLRPH
jgi:xanthosine utilization system XapX-like protein